MVKLNIIKKNWRNDSTIFGSRMSLECPVSMIQKQKLTENGLNKPKQKFWHVRQAILEIAIEGSCGKGCS